MMESLLLWLQNHRDELVRILLTLVAGWALLRILALIVWHTFQKRLHPHVLRMTVAALYYVGGTIVVVSILHELGFRLSALLGAAGILGVAVGFAAQTSLSNFICGVFLVWEKPFRLGDVIQVGTTTGVVQTIHPLSTLLRTFDNRSVRIPNETLMKAEITNITRYPIRRLDVDVGVAFREDVARVTRVLLEEADKNPHCLDEPAPIVLFKGFGDSSLNFMLGVWFAREDFLVVRNSMYLAIKERFDREGIEIPFPHRSLYAGSKTAPFPIRIVNDMPMTGDAAPDTP